MIYFTADLHFYHDKVIQHVNRPFPNAEKMNQVLIENWNRKVGAADEVYILGDVTMKGFYRGAFHLHGHQHNHADYNYRNLEQGIRRYDVGVDANNMCPVSIEEILEFFAMGEELRQ